MGQQRRPFSLEDWRRAGVAVVTRFTELRAVVGLETEAIVIDADGLPDVNVEWLRAQSQPPQPRVIVVINFNLRELQELLNEPQPWTTSWKPLDPHFALVAWGHGCHSAGQDRFAHWSWSGVASFMDNWVDRYAECTKRS